MKNFVFINCSSQVSDSPVISIMFKILAYVSSNHVVSLFFGYILVKFLCSCFYSFCLFSFAVTVTRKLSILKGIWQNIVIYA